MEVSQWDEGINGLLVFEVYDGKAIYYVQQLTNGGFHVFKPWDGQVIDPAEAIVSLVRRFMADHGLK